MVLINKHQSFPLPKVVGLYAGRTYAKAWVRVCNVAEQVGFETPLSPFDLQLWAQESV